MERSPWTLAMMCVTLLLLVAALLLPWYTFDHNTGRQVPPGEPAGEEGPSEERRITYRPYDARGDLSEKQRTEAAQSVLILGVVVTLALLLALVNLVIEIAGGMGEGARTFQLVLSMGGFLMVAASLVYAWFVFPALLAEEGVTDVFTTRNDQATFIRSSLSWGWAVGAVSLLAHAATFAFKYAGGVFSLDFLDEYRSGAR